MDQRVPRQHRPPAVRGGGPHQPTQVTDLVGHVGEHPAGLLDHLGRQVEPGGVGTRVDQVRRDVARPAADLHHRAGLGGDPVEQPALERQAVQLGDQLLGVLRRDRGVGGADLGVAGLGTVRQHSVAVVGGQGGLGRRGRVVHRAEQVDPAVVLLARTTRLLGDQGRVGLAHPDQAGLDGLPVGEGVEPLGARLQRTGRLGAAQQQHGEQGAFVVREPEPLSEGLVVLQRAPAALGPDDPHQPAVLEPTGGRLDQLLVEVGDRLAAAGLVAGGAQRVQRQRVGRRHRHLLLQEAAEHTLLLGGEHGQVRVVGHEPTLARTPGPAHWKVRTTTSSTRRTRSAGGLSSSARCQPT